MIDDNLQDSQKQKYIDEHNNSNLSIYSNASVSSMKKTKDNATSSPSSITSCKKRSNKSEYFDKNSENDVLSDDANLYDGYDECNNDVNLDVPDNSEAENNKNFRNAKKNDEIIPENTKKSLNVSVEKSRLYELNENLTRASPNKITNNTIDTTFSSDTKSSSCVDISVNQQKSTLFQPFFGSAYKIGSAEWYKQYEERLFNAKNTIFPSQTDFLNYVRSYQTDSFERAPQSSCLNSPSQSNQQPVQSTPNNNHSNLQSTDSLLLMERLYSSASNPSLLCNMLFKSPNGSFSQKNNQSETNNLITASQQALLAQYASHLYLNNNQNGSLPSENVEMNGFNSSRMAVAAAMAANYHLHSASNIDLQNLSEKEKYLAPLNFTNAGSLNLNHHNNTENMNQVKSLRIDRDDSKRNRNNSSGSRSSSPTSSQHSGNCCEDDDECESQSINAGNGEWTYEEQFKQLYELSDEPKRKEFLDDLFAFMQKRGSPVNRIPIMAKHVLDLYELYRLVVSKGGLVEVINKKLWREITKGLNLPSSITSAAFTLRTQYMKYLYPYECEKLKMSTPQELQSAIDGNRREGRRPVYGFDYPSPSPISNSVICTGNAPGIGSISSNSKNITNSSSALNFVKPPGLQNELLGSSGLNNQISGINLHHNQHHRLNSNLQQSSQNPHHNAFLAAAAAVHHGSLYDTSSLHPHQLSQLNLAHNAANISTFLKPYFEFNTSTQNCSSSITSTLGELTSSKENELDKNNLDKEISSMPKSVNRISSHNNKNFSLNFNTNSNTIDSFNQNDFNNEKNFNKNSLTILTSHKRPFDHLDQNSDSYQVKGDSLKELQSKKQNTENFSDNKTTIVVNSNQSSNLNNKIKILSKDIIQNNNILTCTSEKSISLSIEINGNLYHGTLYSSTSSSLSPTNSNLSASLSSESMTNNQINENNNFENSVKPDILF